MLRTEELETIKLPPLPIYAQSHLIRKINLYFQGMRWDSSKPRPYWHPKGYCHGLVLYWQQKMAERKEEKEFYQVIKKIIHCPKQKLCELDNDIAVQEFLEQVEFAQNPLKYSNLSQWNVDDIQGTSPEIYIKEWLSLQSFEQLVEKYQKKKPAITVTTMIFKNCHTIGIYYRDNQYYIFDGNYENGEGKQFADASKVAFEMMDCLFYKFGLQHMNWMNNLRVIFTNPVPSNLFTLNHSCSKNQSTFFHQKLNESREMKHELKTLTRCLA